jgi:chromatin assembly factor 1 subunit B
MIRRLSWSTDGLFLLTPASVYRDLQTDSKNSYTVYGFLKTDLTQPAFMLPGIKSHATCIKFNPYFYKKKHQEYSSEEPPLVDLPYRMVFAVATMD